jgi:NTP pyrophosphatase (non-canonical NTP hydrolase)
MVKARWDNWRKRGTERSMLLDQLWKVEKECLFWQEQSVRFEARLRKERGEHERKLAEFRDECGLPGLSPAEIERLAMLAEECGEVVQAVGKVLRHGWDSSSPYGSRTNRATLEREVGDVRAVIGLMLDYHDLHLAEVQTWQRRKRAAVPRRTHYQDCSMSREEQLEMMRAAR